MLLEQQPKTSKREKTIWFFSLFGTLKASQHWDRGQGRAGPRVHPETHPERSASPWRKQKHTMCALSTIPAQQDSAF